MNQGANNFGIFIIFSHVRCGARLRQETKVVAKCMIMIMMFVYGMMVIIMSCVFSTPLAALLLES